MKNWQLLTLNGLPIPQWRQSSYLNHLVGLLEPWRQGSWLMRWAEPLGVLLVSAVFAAAPFIANDFTGLLLLSCAGYWVILTLSDPLPRLPRGMTATHLIILLYWGINCVAAAFSPVKRPAFIGLGKLTLYLVLFALLARLFRSARARAWVVTVYLLAALVVSLHGINQWFSGAAALATWVDPESPLANITRVYSFLGNPNLLAAYLVPAIGLSAVAILAWPGVVTKVLAVLMLGANTTCLVFTFSRGGWIGAVVTLALLLLGLVYWYSDRLPAFWRLWALPTVIAGLGAVLLVGLLLVPSLRERVLSIFAGRQDSSNNFRINVWEAVLAMIRHSPVLGYGPGNQVFNRIYPLFQHPRFNALGTYCIPLEIAVESGLVGLGAFLWALAATAHRWWLQLTEARARQDQEALWLIAAGAILVGMMAHGLVDTVWYRPEVNTLWWMLMALVVSYRVPRQAGSRINTASVRPPS